MVQDNLNGNLRREEVKIWVWPLHTGGYGKPFLRMRNLLYLLSDSPWQNGNACFYCPPYPLHLPQASQGKKLYSSARIHVFLDSVNRPSQKTEHIVEYGAYSRIKTMPSIDTLPPAPAQHLLLCYLLTKATIYFKLNTALGNLNTFYYFIVTALDIVPEKGTETQISSDFTPYNYIGGRTWIPKSWDVFIPKSMTFSIPYCSSRKKEQKSVCWTLRVLLSYFTHPSTQYLRYAEDASTLTESPAY